MMRNVLFVEQQQHTALTLLEAMCIIAVSTTEDTVVYVGTMIISHIHTQDGNMMLHITGEHVLFVMDRTNNLIRGYIMDHQNNVLFADMVDLV